uniref:Enoyl-CoA hydratase n=1 Tax=Gongylonema pulchrum TaxID=637853 RepID=A0A183DAG2_9BILA
LLEYGLDIAAEGSPLDAWSARVLQWQAQMSIAMKNAKFARLNVTERAAQSR